MPDSSVGNLWYKNNFSRMPGSWRFHGGTNIPPYVEGVCDVLCGVVECKRRRGAKNESSSKTSLISHTVHYTHVSYVFKRHRISSLLHIPSCSGLFRWRGNSFSFAHAKVRSDLKSLSCLFEAKRIFFISLPYKPPPLRP